MTFGFGLGFPRRTSAAGFSPRAFFASGEQGVWYDPSDVNVTWRRNLLTYTEQFDNAYWTKFNVTATSNATAAPDEAATADSVVPNTTNAQHSVYRSAVAAAGTYTASIYAKAFGYNTVQLYLFDGAFKGTATARLDLGTVVIAGTGTPSGTIVALANGWYRITLTATTAASTEFGCYVGNNGSVAAFVGDTVSGVYLWGTQLEAGSTASAYQQIVTPEITYLQSVQPQPILYQDSAGTTPVTAIEQPVGLMLDKSKGLILGSELVTNGTFTTSTTGWTSVAATLSVDNERLKVDGSGGLAYQIVPVVVGRAYQFTGVKTSGTGTAVMRLGTSVQGSQYVADVTTSAIITATTTTLYITLYPTGGATAFFDNISVRELPGNHATQATSASRPVLSAKVNLLTYTEEFTATAWSLSGDAVRTLGVTDPLGGNTAVRITAAAGGFRNTALSIPANSGQYISRVWLRATTAASTLWVGGNGGGTFPGVVLNITTSWAEYAIPSTGTVADAQFWYGRPLGGQTCTEWEIWHPDVRSANESSTIPSYQRVTAATDYDPQGFLPYLRFESDDSLSTPSNIDFATVTSDGQTRRNLLTFPSAFDNSAWGTSSVAITPNVGVAPDGTATADLMRENGPNGHHVSQSYSAVAGTAYTLSAYFKNVNRRYAALGSSNFNNFSATFDLDTGVTVANAATASSMQSVGGGWWRCAITFTATTTVSSSAQVAVNSSNNGLIQPYAASSTPDLLVWAAQLEVGSTATAFQNIGTDKMTVFAGVRKLADTPDYGCIVENTTNNGSFSVFGPGVGGTYFFTVAGTARASYSASTFAAPSSAVLSVNMDISGTSRETELFPRVNGGTPTLTPADSADAGTGNFGSHVLHVGRRNNSTLPFNGRMYQLIVRGAKSTQAEIYGGEGFTATKTGLTLPAPGYGPSLDYSNASNSQFVALTSVGGI